MDALTDLLDGPRARGAFLLCASFRPPWAVLVADEAPLTLMAMVRGEAWVTMDGGEPVRIGPGDVALARGPRHYTVADAPSTAPQVMIHPDQTCTTLDGGDAGESMGLGVRTWGNDPDGPVRMLIGTYQAKGEVTGRLLAALPELAVLTRDTFDSPLVPLLGEEIVQDRPGQDVVLDRLLDLLMIAVLRAWFSRPSSEPPGWFRAHGDPVVAKALRLLHGSPGRAWTVATLAAETGVSRATLAQRFGTLVGEPPMTYLTGLRLATAADLLRDGEATLEAVARRVGYGDAFALSTAFKRWYGLSPRDYRAAAR